MTEAPHAQDIGRPNAPNEAEAANRRGAGAVAPGEDVHEGGPEAEEAVVLAATTTTEQASVLCPHAQRNIQIAAIGVWKV